MNTETKNKIISWMVIISFCFCLSITSYCIGHYKAEKKCIEILTGIKEHLEQLTGEELLEKDYSKDWCDTNYSKRCKIEKISGVWTCHPENYTEKEISTFIEQNYTKKPCILFVDDEYYLYYGIDNWTIVHIGEDE